MSVKNVLSVILFFIVLTFPLRVLCGEELEFSIKNKPARGQPLLIEISAGTGVRTFSVKWQEIQIKVPASCDETYCTANLILPTIYEKSGSMPITVGVANFEPDRADRTKKTMSGTIDVADKVYDTQSLTVEPRYVNIDQKTAERTAKERKLISAALKTFSNEKQWTLPLLRPVPGAISGDFGVQRVFNGEPRSKHTGMDFKGSSGEAVSAVADGTVVLTGEHYFAGNSVYVDHGQGVVSMYFHLSKILLNTGDRVKAGDLVGLVGATGRTTGPHLHFGLAAQGILIDPIDLFE